MFDVGSDSKKVIAIEVVNIKVLYKHLAIRTLCVKTLRFFVYTNYLYHISLNCLNLSNIYHMDADQVA